MKQTTTTAARVRKERTLPLFSFLMPCYTAPDCFADVIKVGKAIQSVMDQTDDRWQIVMVSDGPSPRLRDVYMDSLKQCPEKIKYIEAPYIGQRGGHHSVEVGKEYCTGEFLTILNGDNTVRPTYVADLYEKDADVLVCMVKMNDNPGLVLDGTGFSRSMMDRLNYSIRTGYAKKVHHRMNIDADYDFLKDCLDRIMTIQSPRIHYVEKILGEHN